MLAEQLKFYRESSKLSQDDIADALMISRQAVSKWENDRTYPDLDNLIRLSNLYSVSIDELLKGDARIQNKLKNDGELVDSLKSNVSFLRRKRYNLYDESLELLIISLSSATVPLIGAFLPVYVLLRNNKFNHLNNWILLTSIIVMGFSIMNCTMSIYDIFFTNFHLVVRLS
ncbi:helix-turn-helix transcriptional regulator [Lactiplantibacillus plantarum]|uniref:helix-turn-helix domain-containing protein n=1 Tax=Lactiplantibacillus plantarum TaxID=1590 RepID=UPI000D2230AA|nr:helix-turn-helix transcriptional regulator [Lactiplantibacillus plantarum]AVV98138.1 transcriptional regulator [Lactiplantibacillus plantarum]AVW06684.1 transcriptional regulator [Lactiplantibacillus plantarum]MCC9314017.1 helix-turn-helix transcriptional regulator [Lactiplantibacillus plantarum]MDF3263208.1 helix-turn-helix transcriptional regulator [Lactiplantibacillus plantarum]MDO1603466.1 helix-turn-helix transcriptional regulator [Lactiplantibacillus plantarum]